MNPCVQRDKQHNNGNGRLYIRMKTKDGKWKNVFVKSLMIDKFFGGYKGNEVYAHRNGFIQDCSVFNLVKTTRQEVGKKSGGSSRRSVEKVDRYGNVVALYASTAEAAKANYISRKSIWMRCTNQVKDPYLLDGHTYRYEESGKCKPHRKVKK